MSDVSVEIIKIGLSAIVGGLAGHVTAQRSERDSAIKDLINSIDAAASLGEDYWCSPSDAVSTARMAQRLRVKVKDIAIRNERMIANHPTYAFQAIMKVVNFRRALTDGSFEVAGRATEIERTTRIHQAALELREAILDSRCRLWHVKRGSWKRHLLRVLRR